jgi:hypothetical protein
MGLALEVAERCIAITLRQQLRLESGTEQGDG